MNITFLIGNGFDLNLGLKTRYTDFLEEYLKDESGDSKEIQRFKADIRKQNLEDSNTDKCLWANAELAFGEYTDEIANQGLKADSFSIRHSDFCRKLAVYLQKQEERICIQTHEEDFVKAILEFSSGLTNVQKGAVNDSMRYFGGGYSFNFLVFNYTCIIDQLYNSMQEMKVNLGMRVFRDVSYQNSLGRILHVHGTTKRDMVFGVHGESQIKNMSIFEGVSPFYLDSFIKQRTNAIYEANTDENAQSIVRESELIYIYGMSIGETDTLWWERIIKRMKAEPHLHVFIYCIDAPKEELLRVNRKIYEAEKKEHFLQFATGDNSVLKERIHIVDNNIFGAFTNITTQSDDVQSMKTDIVELRKTS